MSFQTRPSLIARLRDSDDAKAWREFVARYEPFICRAREEEAAPPGGGNWRWIARPGRV